MQRNTHFFATLHAELFDHERFETRDEALAAIGDYMDNFYDVERAIPISAASTRLSSNYEHNFIQHVA